MNPVPVMVNVKGVAVFTLEMLNALMAGTGFSKVTVADAVFVGSAVLTVTVFDVGTAAGAV
jgi:hypothetical protein